MINHCKKLLAESAGAWSIPTSGEWHVLVSNNYQPQYSTLALLWFHDGGEFPRVITKVFHDSQIPQREFESLKQVYKCAPGFVPRPLHFGSLDGHSVLWMEGVPGIPFRARKNFKPALLRSMVEAVASLHSAVRSGPRSDPDRHRRMVLEPLGTLAHFGGSASVRDGCARLAERITAEWLSLQPVILQHGDLFPGNVLSHKSQWRFIDWESFGMVDLPFYDLLTLLLSLLRARGDTPGEWDPAFVKMVPSLVKYYSHRLRLPSQNISLLLPLTLANWFHLQWSDGRAQFAIRMYKIIEHYFENVDLWQSTFCGEEAI